MDNDPAKRPTIIVELVIELLKAMEKWMLREITSFMALTYSYFGRL